MQCIVLNLLSATPFSLIHSPLHRACDLIRIEDCLTLNMSGGAANGLNQ